MSRILIFSGTTEGRRLAELLARAEVACDCCVATEYGSAVMEPSPYITVHEGRLDAEGMRRLYDETGCETVVDATHPYAVLATQTIKESLEGINVEYIRLLREPGGPGGQGDGSSCPASMGDKRTVPLSPRTTTTTLSPEACAKTLLQTEGNILLTTGSKDLHIFAREEALRPRLIVRVIPSVESLNICYENGLTGRQIIAAQGPFSQETNIATIHQYDIRHLVMKQSGHTGGEDAKRSAVEKTGVTLHVIGRPDSRLAEEEGLSLREVLTRLEERLNIRFEEGRLQVALVGIGCGSEGSMTVEARETIAQADFIFGARRLLDAVQARGEKYPCYLAKDILPKLDAIKKTHPEGARIAVLFSGDTGFYSGAEKLHRAFEQAGVEHVTLPGISSMVMFFARLSLSWQDAAIVSTHGVPPEQWEEELTRAVRTHEKTFFLTSGLADVKRIGKLLAADWDENARLHLGWNLSYEDERVFTLQPEECEALETEGLYVGAVVKEGFRDNSGML